jgi:DNA-binding XRE family transcriptional regulator
MYGKALSTGQAIESGEYGESLKTAMTWAAAV